LRWGFYD